MFDKSNTSQSNETTARLRKIRDAAYRISLARCRNRAIASSIAQETALEAFKRLAEIENDESWAKRVAINKLIDRRRHEGVCNQIGGEAAEEIIGIVKTTDPTPSTPVHLDELRDKFRRRVLDLPEGMRGVAFLHIFDQKSALEIATSTGLPLSTVYYQIGRLRKLLQTVESPDDP